MIDCDTSDSVIASASEAIHATEEVACFVARTPLRKRFVFVAGNDEKRHYARLFARIKSAKRWNK